MWNGKRYHCRSLTIDRPYSYKLREAIKTGEAKILTGEPKLLYKYQIRNCEIGGTRKDGDCNKE